MLEFRDGRYAGESHAYGEEPNRFLRHVVPGQPPGRILLPDDVDGTLP